jgi:predicted secreted hydrolase
MRDPKDKPAGSILALTGQNRFPPPTTLIVGNCHVGTAPRFAAVYGDAASVAAVPGHANTFRLKINGNGTTKPRLDLTFSGVKPPMYVGGDGNTGVVVPTDMKYVSLTRCKVDGTIDDGHGVEKAASATGWFDHQWGDTWTTNSVGWDWWGIQLADGRDVLMFRQRHMDTGAVFAPMATIEDADGNLTVTHNVVFTPDPSSIWRGTTSQVRYPLHWKVDLPDQRLELDIAPTMSDQEMPILGGRNIWEGSVKVSALQGSPDAAVTSVPVQRISGDGYQELVGYGSPIVADQLSK